MRTARLKEGYGTIQRDVMCMKELSVYAKAVYALFVSYTGQKDCCYPSIETICNNLTVSRPTVIKAIHELEKVNLLTVERNTGETSVYYPNYILAGESECEVKPTKQEAGKEEQEFFKQGTDDIYIGFDDITDEKGNVLHTGFWTLYDKKTDKKKATTKWKKLKSSTRADIMQKIPLYKLFRPDREFRKSPYSYLLNECWNDEGLHPPTAFINSKKSSNPESQTGRLSTTW